MSDLFPWLEEADEEINEPDGVIEDPGNEIQLTSNWNIDQSECDDEDILDIDNEPSEEIDNRENLIDYMINRAWRREENLGEEFDFNFEFEEPD